MRKSGVSYSVDGLNRGVCSRVITNGVIGSRQVVVNCSWNANGWNSKFLVELVKSGKCTVATNCNKCIYTLFPYVIVSFLSSFWCSEFAAPGCLKDSASALYDVSHRTGIELNNVAFDHAFVSSHDTAAILLIIGAGANDGSDGGIHSWSIATRREHSNLRNFILHLDFKSNKNNGRTVLCNQQFNQLDFKRLK